MLSLRFSPANQKLRKLQKAIGLPVFSFDTSAGVNCPFAKACRSQAVYDGSGFRIQDGPHTQFRCYAASEEVIFRPVREMRLQNGQIHYLPTMGEMVETLSYHLNELPFSGGVMRIHTSGDFTTQRYFDAWLKVAETFTKWKFYAYTKALPLWLKRRAEIPVNFSLVASYGGTHDYLIQQENLRFARVYNYKHEAEKDGLPIDLTDELAYDSSIGNFGLLVHGIQPKGTEAAKAWQQRKQKLIE